MTGSLIGLRFGTLNIGGLGGKRGEVCETVRKRMVDVCCLLEMRWRGRDSMML